MSTFFDETRAQLTRLGLPGGDSPLIEGSSRTFEDGCQYRIEVPTVNSARAAETLLSESRRRGFTINRITETRGLFRHTAREVAEYVELGREYGAEILMSVGPRASYDTGASAHTPEGMRIGYRLRGQEQIVRAVEDVKRGVDLGVRGFVVYDEGLLWVLNRLRLSGDLPKHLHLKVSAHCGHGNPASAQMLESLGADSFNPVRDLSVPMIAALRQAVSIPLDCHVDNPKASGGFIRTYEAPEFVRVAAPVYLKTGNSALEGHGTCPTPAQLDDILHQVEITTEFLGRHHPAARQSPALDLAKRPAEHPARRLAPVSP
ncbi:U32 family peptidase [Kitasatospora sp. MMS16-BH015]|uniref:U32 family peptidase n=1 Tax=Kitasatospora sp. MMS16-BH015 TaxID=2018025 RepID=UPI0020C30257|nr:U32 family peptidase [Kitasatospora sp. MMS16-BH015]